jgi:hypothetical protein
LYALKKNGEADSAPVAGNVATGLAIGGGALVLTGIGLLIWGGGSSAASETQTALNPKRQRAAFSADLLIDVHPRHFSAGFRAHF